MTQPLRALLKEALKLATKRTSQVFLEVFAGEGVLANQIRKMGFGVVSIDIKKGPRHDVCNPHIRRLILGWIRSGVVVGVWLGTPCTTWSIAYTTPQVRSLEHIYGLPGLNDKQAAAVALGNRTMTFSCTVIHVCLSVACPVLLESPGSSRMWHAPPLARLLARATADVLSDYCQFGTRWRKRTRVVGWCCGSADALNKRCCGHKGICSKTKQPHIQLSGSPTGSSKLWTLIAEPYPRPWAAAAARLLVDSAENSSMSRLLRFVA